MRRAAGIQQKGVVEVEGRRYRIGHHPSSGYHIQVATPERWRSSGESWSNSYLISYQKTDRARAEAYLARLVELGDTAAFRTEYQTEQQQLAKERQARQAANLAINVAPLLDASVEVRRAIRQWELLSYDARRIVLRSWDADAG